MTINTMSKASIAALTLVKADEALTARQGELAKIFEEAKGDDGSLDFNKVTCLGDEVKGSIAVAEKVKQYDQEMNALGEHADTLRSAEQAMKNHQERSKARRTFGLPGGGGASGKGNYADETQRFKSLGEMVSEAKDYDAWVKQGSPQGLSMQFDDVSPSDFLAAANGFNTLGMKALMSRTAGYGPESLRAPGFVDAVTRPIQMLDIIPMGMTSQAAYKYMEETTRVHGADFAAEGAAAAESTFVFTEKSAPVEKVADSVPVTDEQLEDVDGMQAYIDGRLTFGVRQKFDATALIGTGVAPQLRGLKNTVGIQTQAKAADPVPDAFFKAMTKVRVTGRSIPTHHILHPTDWQGVRLMRTADGVYIWGNPSEAGPERLWGLGVVQNDADVAGTGYTGSFTPDCVSAFERKGVEVQVGFVGTQFLEGKRTIKASGRWALVWFRPVGFCSVTGL